MKQNYQKREFEIGDLVRTPYVYKFKKNIGIIIDVAKNHWKLPNHIAYKCFFNGEIRVLWSEYLIKLR